MRRCLNRARARGLDRDGDVGQLTDELVAVVAGARPSRPDGKSEAWEAVAAQHEQIKARLDAGLTVTKVHILLGRRGVVVSYRTLHRYATTELSLVSARRRFPPWPGRATSTCPWQRMVRCLIRPNRAKLFVIIR